VFEWSSSVSFTCDKNEYMALKQNYKDAVLMDLEINNGDTNNLNLK
jgi:hypothetical protein